MVRRTKPARSRLGRPPGPSRDRSQEILASALRLFSERGYDGVSIKDIAGATGVNVALIYYYFEDKQHLFGKAIEFVLQRALARYQALTRYHREPIALLHAWLDSNLAEAATLSAFVAVVTDYRLSGLRLRKVDQLIDAFYDQEIHILASAMRAGVSAGVFRKTGVDADRLARLVSTSLDGVMSSAYLRPGFDLPGALAQLRAVLFFYLGAPAAAATAGAAGTRGSAPGRPTPR